MLKKREAIRINLFAQPTEYHKAGLLGLARALQVLHLGTRVSAKEIVCSESDLKDCLGLLEPSKGWWRIGETERSPFVRAVLQTGLTRTLLGHGNSRELAGKGREILETHAGVAEQEYPLIAGSALTRTRVFTPDGRLKGERTKIEVRGSLLPGSTGISSTVGAVLPLLFLSLGTAWLLDKDGKGLLLVPHPISLESAAADCDTLIPRSPEESICAGPYDAAISGLRRSVFPKMTAIKFDKNEWNPKTWSRSGVITVGRDEKVLLKFDAAKSEFPSNWLTGDKKAFLSVPAIRELVLKNSALGRPTFSGFTELARKKKHWIETSVALHAGGTDDQ